MQDRDCSKKPIVWLSSFGSNSNSSLRRLRCNNRTRVWAITPDYDGVVGVADVVVVQKWVPTCFKCCHSTLQTLNKV